MFFSRSLVIAIAVAGCGLLAAFGQQKPLALQGAHLIPIDGPEIDDGTLVIHEGVIVYAGPSAGAEIPQGAETRNVKGMVIMPGLVDTHSHIGGPSGGDRSAPIQPETRVWDSINVRSAQFPKAMAGGITTVNVMPGSGHLLSGQTLYLKLRKGRIIDDLMIRDENGVVAGGVKMANGTNSRRNPPYPGTRAKSAALVRQMFLKAQAFGQKRDKAKEEGKPIPRDLAMESLLDVLEGRKVVHHHTHRHDDILTVLRIAKEFNFEVVLHHVSEGWRVADEIAAAGAPASMIVLDSPGGKLEAKNLSMETGKILEEAGVDVGFHTDDPITDSRLFLRSAAISVRYGMSRAKALEGLTLAGARMLHLQGRVGSLTKGKDADFVLLSGDPLSVYTHVMETWVEGAKVFDRTDPKDKLYAVGGYGASHDQGEGHVHGIMEGEAQ